MGENYKYKGIVAVSLTVFLVFWAVSSKYSPVVKYVINKYMIANSTSLAGRDYIKGFEGLRLVAYKDSVGIWTIGYGHTGSEVKSGYSITASQAESIFNKDISSREAQLNKLGLKLNQNQYDAVMSFLFNIGFNKFLSTTLYKKIKANPSDPTIKDEFTKWVYAGGKKLNGLVARRNEEAKTYFA